VHGAFSPRRVGPVAQQVVQEILEDPATPRYLKDDSSYRLSLESLGRLEAIVRLLWSWLETQLEAHDVQELLQDVTEAEEHERHDGAVVTRRSVSRRVESVLGQIRRYEIAAAQARKALGLDPSSRSKMAARILQPARMDLAMVAAVMAQKGDSLEDGESPAAVVTDGSGSVVRPRAGKSV
jgi:hypothetical protein